MQWHDLIFSKQPGHRFRRHLLLWLVWWLYVIFTLFVTGEPNTLQPATGTGAFFHKQPGFRELGFLGFSLLVIFKSSLLLLIHFFFCYTSLYYLLPGSFRKNKYWRLFTGVALLSAITIPAGYFLYSKVYPIIDGFFHLPPAFPAKTLVWASIDASLISALKITLVTAAITLLKQWWQRHKEKEQMEKEKINAELQLLKAQIHPTFLFSTLTNIISHANIASPKAPEMLIKLSDLLSYMLYECDAPKVKLEKEIGMIKEYMTLEKIRQGDRLELTFQIKGNLNGQWISPLLLLPFIDNSFSYCNNEIMEQAWVNLEIMIEKNSLSMKLINGMPGIGDGSENELQNLANVQKRLALLYPGRHELKINAEEEMLIVHLNLTLEEPLGENQEILVPIKPDLNYA